MADDFNIAAATPAQCEARLASLEGNADWGKLVSSRDAGAYAELHALSAKISGVELPVHSDGLVRNADGQLDLHNARRNLRNHLPPEVTSSEHGLPTATTEELLEQFEEFRRQGFDD